MFRCLYWQTRLKKMKKKISFDKCKGENALCLPPHLCNNNYSN